jgi:hypothetical protein
VVKRAAVLVAALVPLHSCADADPSTSGGASSSTPAATAERCRVDLHGKGGAGSSPRLEDGVVVLTPRGNGEGWGGREWRYGGREEFDDAVATVRAAVDAAGCDRVAVHGFSNGASFAAAMVCAGETLDGRLVGVLVDDPVTDDATRGCARPDDVPVVVLWTGALDTIAPAGTACAEVDWTCSGGAVRGIDAFVDDLGLDATSSPYREHRRHDGAPQPAAWLAG